ncbi:hypothetical protein I7I48_09148 [Histoplasma ohiense]|nr:hypothetical protein I7I48_09148 [Histoplasma ohiense (nom. inval.)]
MPKLPLLIFMLRKELFFRPQVGVLRTPTQRTSSIAHYSEVKIAIPEPTTNEIRRVGPGSTSLSVNCYQAPAPK